MTTLAGAFGKPAHAVDLSALAHMNRHPQLSQRFALVRVSHDGLPHVDPGRHPLPLNVSTTWPMFVYNPAVFDAENVFVKLSPYTYCVLDR